MSSNIQLKWFPEAKKKIEVVPKKTLFSIARQTLDMSVRHIPMKTGNMRSTSTGRGVQADDEGYYIGSYTTYAKYVWKMGAKTNWSQPNTFGKWYAQAWKMYGKTIMVNAIKENMLK